MNFIKTLIGHITGAILYVFESLMPGKVSVRSAIRKVESNISELGRHANNLDRTAKNSIEKAKEYETHFESQDRIFRSLVKQGGTPSKSEIELALGYKKVAAALRTRAESYKAQYDRCMEGIRSLADTRDELTAKLRLAELSDETRSLKLGSVADIDYSVKNTKIDVQDILRSAGAKNDSIESDASVHSVEVNEYLESLQNSKL